MQQIAGSNLCQAFLFVKETFFPVLSIYLDNESAIWVPLLGLLGILEKKYPRPLNMLY